MCSKYPRHDSGKLPKLKEGGPHAVIATALLEAKKDKDEYLTPLIFGPGSTKVMFCKTFFLFTHIYLFI